MCVKSMESFELLERHVITLSNGTRRIILRQFTVIFKSLLALNDEENAFLSKILEIVTLIVSHGLQSKWQA